MKRIYQRTGLRLLFALLWAFPLLGQPTALQPGRLVVREIPAVDAARLFNGSDGFSLEVGEDVVAVEFRLSSSPRESNLTLHARFNQDVMRAADGTLVKHFTSESSGETERIVINQNSDPPLEAGRYYVAIEAGFGNPHTFAFLETSVTLRSGATDLVTIASSNFESGQPEGWTRNYPGPEPFVDGSTLGDPTSTLQAIRRPDRSRVLQITSRGSDAFVAPAEYLGNLSLLGSQMRLEFDIVYDAEEAAKQNVEVLMIGPGGTFRWVGPKPTDLVQRITASVEPSLWLRLGGTGTFADTLQNVLRIEIRADYGEPGAKVAIDNVALLGKPAAPSAPGRTEFTSGADGWLPNVPNAPYLQPRIEGATQGDFRSSDTKMRWFGTNGIPGGFLRLFDYDPDNNPDALLAPARYLGDWTTFGPQARIEFDRRHQSNAGSSRGVSVRLVGFGGAYAWVGASPGREWSHYSAPLQADQWALVAGTRTFEEILRAVQRVEVSTDEVAGAETADLDNFEIVVPAAVDPQLSAEPQSLIFSMTQGGSAPTPKIISLASNSGPLQWFAAASADAPWIHLSRSDGQTPGEVAITANPTNLPVGVHRGYVEFGWVGSTQKVQVPVSFNIVSATGPLISQGGVVNAANYRPNSEPDGALTGGMFVAIYGQRLAERTEAAAQIPLTTSLAGTSVSIGGIPAPLVFVSDKQINAVVPQSLTQQGQAQNVTEADVVVMRGNEFSPAERIKLTSVRPMLFSQDATGTGPGAIQNVLGGGQVQLNTFQDPSRPLETVTIYGTGFGPTQTAVSDGFPATGPVAIRGSVRAVIGGVDAQVLYSGLGGLPHLYQVNATLAADTPLGCEIPVRVIVDGVESNTVTMAVTRNGEPCR